MLIIKAIKLGIKKVSVNIKIIVFNFLKVIGILKIILVPLIFNYLF